MKTNRNASSFSTNQITGNQPVSKCERYGIGGGCHPPRNSVVATADTVTVLMYSARKKNANLIELYSVWKPPTSSPSASGRSNGVRLVSPTIAMQ